MNFKPTIFKSIISIVIGIITGILSTGYIRCDFGSCYGVFLIPFLFITLIIYWAWSSFQKK